jgi:hypothetical protein
MVMTVRIVMANLVVMEKGVVARWVIVIKDTTHMLYIEAFAANNIFIYIYIYYKRKSKFYFSIKINK